MKENITYRILHEKSENIKFLNTIFQNFEC